MKAKRRAKRIACNLAIFVLLVAVLGVVVMWLWNALLPELFDTPRVTYWQAVGVLVLSHILLRGTPLYGVRARRRARRRRRIRKQLAAMTSEERAALDRELGLTTDGTPTSS